MIDEAPPERGWWHSGYFAGATSLTEVASVFFIGLVQEPIDDARTLFLLDPSVLRLLLLSEEFIIDFPTHWVLHR
jgi:hypothetical protein